MDYKDFTKRDDAFKKFVSLRKKVLDAVDGDFFADAFADLCSDALAGDCVAQDVVAYFFNHGVQNPNSSAYLLPPNYDYYMSWSVLAGANGNEFALEKLEFFLNPALEAIVNDEEIITTALKRRNINKDNALMVIANLICESIVDQLNLQPKNLIDISSTPTLYSPQKNRVYAEAVGKSMQDVARFLIS